MFTDARGVMPGAVIEADLCIVGAGAAGITIARELANTRWRVCLLESGGLDLSWEAQSLYQGVNMGLPYFALDMCQLRYFGGNTNAWGGWCRPFDDIDFRRRVWVDHSGWPFSAAALAPYYPAAHELCQVERDDYDPERAAAELNHPRARLLPFDPARLETTIYRFSAPTRFGRVYRRLLRQAPDIQCYVNANVLRLRTTPDADRVTHLDVACLSGTRFTVKARHFVLAAGGVENARLLLLSNDVVPKGIGNQHDLVGRFFMEHPHTKRRLFAKTLPLDTALYGLGFRERNVSARLSLPAALQEHEGLLNYSANIHPVYAFHDTRGWRAFFKLALAVSPSRRSDPYIRFAPFGRKRFTLREIADIIVQLDRVTCAAFLQFLQPKRLIRGFVLESKSEQAPNPESRITLDLERDAFGLNRVRLDWRMRPVDRRTVFRAEEIVDAELRRLGIGSLAPVEPEYLEDWPPDLEGGWHQLGTTRMHDDPKQGVVDANGKVHGVANLFIAGGSVFPTGGTAPPTLTVVAMSLRLADHLQRDVLGEMPQIVQRPAPAAPVLSAPTLDAAFSPRPQV